MKRLSFQEIVMLQIGRVFYEEEHGRLDRYHVSVNPSVVIGKDLTHVDWAGKTDKGIEESFRATRELMHYGPNILVDFRKGRKKHLTSKAKTSIT